VYEVGTQGPSGWSEGEAPVLRARAVVAVLSASSRREAATAVATGAATGAAVLGGSS
jgi:hypothetical protein